MFFHKDGPLRSSLVPRLASPGMGVVHRGWRLCRNTPAAERDSHRGRGRRDVGRAAIRGRRDCSQRVMSEKFGFGEVMLGGLLRRHGRG
jgi:hypothetical protein